VYYVRNVSHFLKKAIQYYETQKFVAAIFLSVIPLNYKNGNGHHQKKIRKKLMLNNPIDLVVVDSAEEIKENADLNIFTISVPEEVDSIDTLTKELCKDNNIMKIVELSTISKKKEEEEVETKAVKKGIRVTIKRVKAKRGIQVLCPNSIEELIKLASEKFKIEIVEIWNTNNATIEDIDTINDQDTLFGATQQDIKEWEKD